MIQAAIAFFVLAILFALMGATGVAGISMEVAKVLLFVFIALSVISLIGSLLAGRKVKGLR